MKRRDFFKILLFFLTATLYANKELRDVRVAINGDLDDDLFILKNNSKETIFLECFQMHNPKKFFLYDSKAILSKNIYGFINFDKTFLLKENEILLIATANEREEIHPQKELFNRTHFKSVDLFVDNKVFFPSMMPENNDIPGYPTWFSDENPPCQKSYKEYNYYKLWENSIINLGFVFAKSGNYRFEFLNRYDQIVFSKEYFISKNIQNLKIFKNHHTLCEIDGSLYDGNDDNDNFIKENAIRRVVIYDDKNIFDFVLPYPWVYVNRLYTKALS
jgi:hypothetical protein